jgi:threonine/homoserine/homoserine lactone efflux protein
MESRQLIAYLGLVLLVSGIAVGLHYATAGKRQRRRARRRAARHRRERLAAQSGRAGQS